MNNRQKWLSSRFLIYKFLTNSWFLGAVWLYFYRIFINDAQIGILDGVAFAIGLVAEVPSGVMADKFGRDKMVRIGQFLAGLGLIIQGVGSGLIQFIIGQAVMMIGISFVSGADEALFFDNLKFKENSPYWRKLVTRGSQVALVASISAMLIGGWIHGLNPRLTWMLTGLSFIGSVFFIWPIKDLRIKSNSKKALFELRDQLSSIRNGFLEFTKNKLSVYVPLIITVQGLYYTAGWGVLRLILMDRFHFSPLVGSFVIASHGLITVAVLGYVHKNAENLSEKKVLTLISVSAVIGLLLSILNLGWWGYFILLALYAGEHVITPFMSEVLNYRTDESQRATVLSVSSFLRTLPYVLLAPIIGNLNSNNKLEYFLVVWSILMIIALLVYISRKKQDTKISLVEEQIGDRVPEIAS